MNHSLCFALLMVILAVGCKKEEQPVAQPATDAAPGNTAAVPVAPPAGSPVVAPNTTIAAPEEGGVDATLSQLTFQLRRYIGRTKSLPNGFDDFAAKSQLKVPPPPAGKKYAISKDWRVVLVNN